MLDLHPGLCRCNFKTLKCTEQSSWLLKNHADNWQSTMKISAPGLLWWYKERCWSGLVSAGTWLYFWTHANTAYSPGSELCILSTTVFRELLLLQYPVPLLSLSKLPSSSTSPLCRVHRGGIPITSCSAISPISISLPPTSNPSRALQGSGSSLKSVSHG